MAFFQDITGPNFDSLCDSMGLRPMLVRYGEATVIRPSPIISHLGIETSEDVSSQLSDSEAWDTYLVTIPEAVLLNTFGDRAAFVAAIAPPQLWSISTDGGANWIRCRVQDQPTTGEGQRWELRLVKLGYEDVYAP